MLYFFQFIHRNFRNQICNFICKKLLCLQVFIQLNTHSVTKSHFADCCCNTITIHRIARYDRARTNQTGYLCIQLHYLLIYRQVIFISDNTEGNKLIACLLQFRCDDILLLCYINRK